MQITTNQLPYFRQLINRGEGEGGGGIGWHSLNEKITLSAGGPKKTFTAQGLACNQALVSDFGLDFALPIRPSYRQVRESEERREPVGALKENKLFQFTISSYLSLDVLLRTLLFLIFQMPGDRKHVPGKSVSMSKSPARMKIVVTYTSISTMYLGFTLADIHSKERKRN